MTLLYKAKNQLDKYIKLLPKIKTLLQLEVIHFKAGSIKNYLANW